MKNILIIMHLSKDPITLSFFAPHLFPTIIFLMGEASYIYLFIFISHLFPTIMFPI